MLLLLGCRIQLWRMIVAIAIVAMAFAALRPESAPGAAVAIVGCCLSYITYIEYSKDIIQIKSIQKNVKLFQKMALLANSAIFATAIVGISDVAGLVGYHGYMRLAYEFDRKSHYSAYGDPTHMMRGCFFGLCLGLFILLFIISLKSKNYNNVIKLFKIWPIVIAALVALALVLT